jgi:hypothetical protein
VTFLEPGRVVDAYLDVYTDMYGVWCWQPYTDLKHGGKQRDQWYIAHVQNQHVLSPVEAAVRWLEARPELKTS